MSDVDPLQVAVMSAFDSAVDDFARRMDRAIERLGINDEIALEAVEDYCGWEIADAYRTWLEEA